MPTRLIVLVCSVLLASTCSVLPLNAQENTSASQAANDNTVEGTIASASRDTLVIRTDDHFQLFTYERAAVRPKSIAPGDRVRVTAGPPDENGTRTASDVTVLTAASSGAGAADKGAQAAPVPQKVREVESDIRRESRRWRMGVRGGAAFDPELFTFGIQSQMGPIFHPRVLFRPNAEFAFGEVTDLIALNMEAVYRLSTGERRGDLTSFLVAGLGLIVIHQSYQSGCLIDLWHLDY